MRWWATAATTAAILAVVVVATKTTMATAVMATQRRYHLLRYSEKSAAVMRNLTLFLVKVVNFEAHAYMCSGQWIMLAYRHTRAHIHIRERSKWRVHVGCQFCSSAVNSGLEKKRRNHAFDYEIRVKIFNQFVLSFLLAFDLNEHSLHTQTHWTLTQTHTHTHTHTIQTHLELESETSEDKKFTRMSEKTAIEKELNWTKLN